MFSVSWAAIVNDEGLAGGNAGFVIGDDGVLVVDTDSIAQFLQTEIGRDARQRPRCESEQKRQG